jgi:crossover junction endodeoxyribonuclease RusA
VSRHRNQGGDVSDCIRFEIPWSISTNAYWRTTRTGRTYLSNEAKQFKIDVQAAVLSLGYKRMDGRLAVKLTLFPPNRIRRDVDNFGGKSVLDALTSAGLWQDDSQIDDLHIVRGPCDPPAGSIEVEVRRLP